jgi:hypothetical protein
MATTLAGATLAAVSGDPGKTINRVAHAFNPAEWRGRSLAIAIVVFAVVLSVTVIQRALVADTTSEWVLTVIHGMIVAAIIPLLALRAVSDWRAVQDRT